MGQLAVSGSIGLFADALLEGTETASDSVDGSSSASAPSDGAGGERNVLLHGLLDSVAAAAWVYFALTLVSAVDGAVDIPLVDHDVLSAETISTMASAVWGGLALSTAKRTYLLRRSSGTSLGRAQIYDRLLDFLLALATAYVVLGQLRLGEEVGGALEKIFAASGFGALLFSLASKDLAEQIVAGLTIRAWDAFEVGEDVELGDGTAGTIIKIGLVETELMGGDDTIMLIPNAQIVKERVSNLSRTTRSQVKQVLRFSYDDISSIPGVLANVREEIRSSCPRLVTDGSVPFSARMSSYEADHIEALVNCHFDIQPGTPEYSANREEVLLAIARAVEKKKVKFAIPAINFVNKSPED